MTTSMHALHSKILQKLWALGPVEKPSMIVQATVSLVDNEQRVGLRALTSSSGLVMRWGGLYTLSTPTQLPLRV